MYLRLISFLGLIVFFLIAFLLSENRKEVKWNIVIWGIGLQLFFAIFLIRADLLVFIPNAIIRNISGLFGITEPILISPKIGIYLFEWIKKGFDLITQASSAGAQFLFGNLTELFILDHATVQNAEVN
jgi:nucleoside permease NupC